MKIIRDGVAESGVRSDYKLLSGLFFRLLPYQILLIVINAINGIVDSLFASNSIGQESMSAIGLFAPMTHFLYALSIMLVSGSQLLYGLYIGKNPERIRSVFSVDIIISTGISVLTSLLLVIGAVTNATSVFTDSAEVQAMFNDYLIGQAIGVPALVLGQQLFAFLSLENQTKRTMAASLSCFGVNALMDLLFIVVIPMGTFGLGLASSVSEWVFLIVQAMYYLRGKSSLKFSMKSFNWHDVGDIMKRGYSGALSRFVEMFRCVVINLLIVKWVGDVGLSSFAASNSLLGVVWALPFGMVAVLRMLLSISIGEEDRRSLIDSMRIIFRKALPLMCVVSAILILLAHPLTRMFYRDVADPVYDMTVMGFRLLPACMPLAVISLCFACYAQAIQKKAMSIVLPVIDGFAGVTCLSLFLLPAMKMNGLYLANILNGVICFAVITAFAWKAQGRCPRNVEELLAIPAGFEAPDTKRLDVTVRNMDDVVNISRQVMTFCGDLGADRRRTYLAGLSLEEMASNVVLHGFKKDKKKHHSVDIRVMYSEDTLLLRMRDDCRPFDPASRADLLNEEDITRNIGIRTVFQTAQSVQYQNLLGLNVLTIRI